MHCPLSHERARHRQTLGLTKRPGRRPGGCPSPARPDASEGGPRCCARPWTCAAGLSVHTHPHAERALVRARRVQFSSVRARSYGRPNCAARASRSPFVHSDADFVPRLGMPRRPEGAAPRKRGRPRLADDMISKAGLQKRRQRAANEHAMTALQSRRPRASRPRSSLDKACGRHRCAWPTHSGGG